MNMNIYLYGNYMVNMNIYHHTANIELKERCYSPNLMGSYTDMKLEFDLFCNK